MSDYKTFLQSLPDDRKGAVSELVEVVRNTIPKGFEENVSTMINFQVPLSTYPDGYHCSANTPLPFLSIANQKNFVALYHMGLYANKELLEWFQSEYPKHCKYKLNMGKSCIRFKYLNDIPHQLISGLMSKVSVEDWIETYEKAIKS